MANPSLKNGYISVANELVEKFATISIPSSEMRIVWVVWRKTWGWSNGDRKKDWDWIALSQFEKATTMKHGNVASSLKSLVVKRILLKRENGYKFNQNYDEWVVCKRIPPVVKRILGSSQTHTDFGSQTHTNKRNKETITKDILQSKTTALVVPKKKEIQNPNTPIENWAEYLNKMDESNNRGINIIAHYFRSKGLYFETTGKASSAIKRHLRAAQQLAPFTDEEISKATNEAQKQYPELWTVESLIKILTR